MKRVTHIVSLPRCRTAWLSLAFTQAPDVYGFHDGCGDHATETLLSVEDYHKKMLARPERYIVDCSSGLPSLPQYLAAFDGAVIVIEPDSVERCRDSWLAHMSHRDPEGVLKGVWPEVLDNFIQCQKRFYDRITMRVPFSGITQMMPALWSSVCPGVPYDAQRIADLARLNINEII